VQHVEIGFFNAAERGLSNRNYFGNKKGFRLAPKPFFYLAPMDGLEPPTR
jgi:hypothetical protein